MATTKQRTAARRNIKKAQRTWRTMSARAHARAQPEGRGRARPGTTGKGEFFHVEVRPKSQFKTFRSHDVGKKGGLERVAGRRASGTWDTQKWLISKAHAHMERGRLVPDTADARKVLGTFASVPKHISGDRFTAKDRPNVPEAQKPTPAQKRAQQRNIKKAQMVRRAG
jgi:hypothetical protein